ncbi:MAG: TRAP transporter large permease subunit [Syntrophaceae bacterium]|nr:TRAP transporter large permease subunit [Syntrophaceae bacterium]
MDLFVLSLIGLFILFLLLFMGMPIGYGMALIGFCGAVYMMSLGAGFNVLGIFPYQYSASYNFAVIPLFVLMGEIAFRSGFGGDLYSGVHKLLAGLPGSLAMATVGACAFFGAICGSSTATAATMASVALPEMRKFRYNVKLATGTIASGGTLGILIPPSIIFVIYGIMTEQSIGKLFMAGFLPGLLEASLYMVTIYVLVKIHPDWAPPAPRTALRERISGFQKTWPVFALFIVVVGGIYRGFFTPTEASAVGVLGACLIMLGRRQFTRENFIGSLLSSGRTTGMIFSILIGAMIMNYWLGISELPMKMAEFVANLPIPPIGILASILFIYIILGCLMDSMPMVLLTTPIFYPIIVKMGFNPIWFGVLVVRVVEIGLITPPIGLNVFIIRGIVKDVSTFEIFKGVMPFFAADIICVILLVAFPQISLFLPSLMG